MTTSRRAVEAGGETPPGSKAMCFREASRRALAIAAILLAIPAHAQDAPPEPVVVPPELTRFEEAKLPPDLGVKPGSYVVTLAVTVDETGAVAGVEATASDDDRLTPLALEAARSFAFKPALVDGAPVAVKITYRYTFDVRARERSVVFVFKVRRKGTREPVDGLTALVEENGRSFTSVAGTLEVSDLPPGAYTLYVPEEEWVEVRQPFEVKEGEAGEAELWAERRYGTSHQTVIRAPREARFVAKLTLQATELARLPGSGGDPLKMIENLPGLARSPFGGGQLIVFGADFLDSHVLLDSQPMWWFYHFGGLYSTINPAFIDRIDFMPAAFDASYGNAIGGIVDVRLKDELLDGVHGAVDVNIVHAGAIVGFPYSEDGDLTFALRRSYIDAVLKLVFMGNEDFGLTTAPVYYDYQFQWRHRFGSRNRVRLFVNGSDDAMEVLNKRNSMSEPTFVGSLGLSMWIHAASFEWESDITQDLKSVLSAKVLPMGFDMNVFGSMKLKVTQLPIHLREDLEWRIRDDLRLRAGLQALVTVGWLDVRAPHVPYGGAVPAPLGNQDIIEANERISVADLAPWASLEWQPFPWWTIVPSVRMDAWVGDWKRVYADPRLSMRFQIDEQWAVKAATGLYQQTPPVFTFSKEFGGGDLGPESAVHLLAGVEWQPLPDLFLQVEGFYKHLYNQVEPSNDKTVRYTNDGYGRAFGGDFLLRVNPGGWHFFGWLAYTYVVAQRWDFARDDWRSSDTDQRHVLNVVGTYELPHHWYIGLRFRLASGYPYTPVTGSVFDADTDQYVPIPSPWKNSARLPLFHQLDLRVDKEWIFDNWKLALYLEVQNVYNNRAAEAIQYSYDYGQTDWVSGLPILPVFGIKGEF
jgi:TonB family protein